MVEPHEIRPLPPAVLASLRDVFGFAALRPGQAEVVGSLLAGRSALAVFPTGGGKSLCYQLPALHFEGLSLVVSPLIALMKDQIDFLQRRGVAAARLDSSLTGPEARQVYEDLRAGALRLLYVAPERFQSERFLQRLGARPIDLLAIDEAHCISEWGHNFRPDYLKLAARARELGVRRVLALTATATPPVADDICREFGISRGDFVNTGFYRPNLTLRATPCARAARGALLRARLRARPRGATIVYVTLQRTAERVAERLAADGLPARAYHAGMETEQRTAVQDWFMASADAVVVATIAFGMGIDKADIRYVYHYNLPKGLENFSQEVGRAGRDGAPSTCELLACADDVVTLENFAYGDTPTPEAVRNLLDDVLGRGERFDVSQYRLSRAHDIRPLVVSTLLTYLELDGVLRATAPFYDTYRFRATRSEEAILARFDARRARFLRELFARARRGRVWASVDLTDAARALGEPRGRLVAAFNYLEEKGEIELRVAGLRHGYRRLGGTPEPGALAERLAARFVSAEAREVGRIQRVLDLATREGCVVRALLAYFGEELGRDCGHCDRCLGEPIPPLPPATTPPLDEGVAALVRELRGEAHEALAAPRQLARFLCGLASPAMTRVRPSLTRDPRFGALGRVPFGEVLDFVTS